MRISGIKKIKKKIFINKKGDLIKYISTKDRFFKKFGEVYFSEIKKKKTKGWNLHTKYKCHLAVISGKVKFNFIDNRKNSKTYLKKDTVILSKKNYSILLVPPNIWFSFTTENKVSLIVNMLNYPHSDIETKKK
tara:strand:- start:82 stop:483 length:402 start_codon:yes stop_codon:yes gene_type:complete